MVDAQAVVRRGRSLNVAGFLQTLRGAFGHRRAAGVQFRRDAELRHLADVERQPDPGGDDRDRLGRHDAGHRHRRHRPLGRFADGDLGGARAADLSQPVRARHLAIGNILAFVVPIGVAGLLGLFNGWFITRFRVQPIVATLVLFIAGRGIGQVITNGNLQTFKNPSFQFIGLGRVFGVPCQVLVMLALVAAAAWMLRRTLFGRQILAVGGNEKAARLAGVPVAPVKRWVYAISGLCAGVAGLVVVSINSSSDANLVGLGMELDAIAAVAVGGTPFTGGRATVVGSLLGALLIQLLRYTLLANGVPDAAALVVKGAIIAGAVWSQQRSMPS